MFESLYKKAKRLIVVNDVLRYVAIALCAYLLLLPYIPAISYKLHKDAPPQVQVPSEITEALKNGIDYLSVPSVGISQVIVEAKSIKEVHERVWRRPATSTPDKGSNTVLVAHRYATIGGNRSSTFYELPSLVVGEKVYVTWKGKLYTYQVTSEEVVLPDEVSVENPTEYSELTLYTCTPLWTATHRFVVHARLVE